MRLCPFKPNTAGPSRGQQLLDVAVAQGEAEIEPDRLLDDLVREAMPAGAERSHADILPDTPLAPDPVSLPLSRRTLLSQRCRDDSRNTH
jgi:hypothetical protein